MRIFLLCRRDLFDPYAAFDTDSEENFKCIHTLISILRAICLSDSHDISGYLIRDGIADIRFCGPGSSHIFCHEGEKSGDGGMFFLYRCFYHRTYFRVNMSRVHETVKEI